MVQNLRRDGQLVVVCFSVALNTSSVRLIDLVNISGNGHLAAIYLAW